MERSDFGKLLTDLVQLTEPQRKRLRLALDTAAQSPLQALVAALPPPQECPYCRADQDQLHPWGQSHGLARLRCQACHRTFNALTASPLAHLSKREHWLRYGQALVDGLCLRQAAARCGVDKDTALRWRHRFLVAAAKHRAEREGGIVEADETFFLESFKGQRHLHRPARKRGDVGQLWERIAVLVLRDRSGQTADFQLERADTQHIAAVLRPLVEPDAILCTDGAAVYKAVSRTLGLTHRPINVQQGIRVREGSFHIQNVNAYDARLKAWLRRFHGVATKYLAHYLGWRRLLERYRQNITSIDCF